MKDSEILRKAIKKAKRNKYNSSLLKWKYFTKIDGK